MGASAVLLLVVWVMPWFRGAGELADVGRRGWDYFLGGTVPALVAVGMLVVVVVRRWFPSVRLPVPPAPWPRTMLLSGLVSAVLVVPQMAIGERTCVEGSCGELDREPAVLVAALATVGLAVGGYLEWRTARPADRAGDDPAPPTPP